MTMLSRALLVSGLSLALGCSGDFDPDFRLSKTRVLAIQAEPPQPAFGSSTTLRALLYVPDDETPSYRWSWCPAPTRAEDAFACPLDQAGFERLLGLPAGLAPSLDLGSGETAVLPNPFAPDVLATLCTGDAGATLSYGLPLDGAVAGPTDAGTAAGAVAGLWSCASAGFPVTVRMQAQTPSMAKANPDRWLDSVFKVYLPTDATLPGNQNPVMGGLSIIAPAPGGPLDTAGSLGLARHEKHRLKLDMDAAVSETFRGWARDELGGYRFESGRHVIGEVQEIIGLRWYVEGGTLDDGNPTDAGNTGFNPYAAAPRPFGDALEIDWETPKPADYPRERVRIVVVVRDDRGGVGWTQGAVTLEAQP